MLLPAGMQVSISFPILANMMMGVSLFARFGHP